MTAKLPALRAELQDDAKFKEVYQYSFNFSKVGRCWCWLIPPR